MRRTTALMLLLAACSAPPPVIESHPDEWDALHAQFNQADSTREAAARDHYLLAERALAEEDFARAELECDKALALDPHHASAFCPAGEAASRQEPPT